MNANAQLIDRHISRALTLERIKSGESSAILRLMRRLERDLLRDLERANLTSWRKDRYDRLLLQARDTIRSHYRTIRDTHQEKLTALADLESTWTVQAVNRTISEPVGVYIDIASVAWTPAQLSVIASDAVIDGAVSASWWSKQAAQTRRDFASTVKSGLLRGTSTQEIARTIRNEVYPTSRRNAEALVRTSIAAVSAKARFETLKSQGDILQGFRQLSVLDGRTCLLAGSLIATPSGLRSIEQIQVGESVLGGSSNVRQVVGTRQVKTQKVAVVNLSNGQTIHCTPDHLFLLATQEWTEAKDLSPGVILAERQEV